MDEIVGGVHPPERFNERVGIQHVARDDLRPTREPVGEVPGVTSETADPFSTRLERRDEPSTDVSARPGDENATRPPILAPR